MTVAVVGYFFVFCEKVSATALASYEKSFSFLHIF